MSMIGPLLAMGSAAGFSLTGHLIRRSGNAAGTLAGLVLLLAVQAALSLFIFGMAGASSAPSLLGVALFLLTGILAAVAGNVLIIFCVRNAGPARASAAKVAALVVGMALAMLIFGDRLGWTAWIGTLLILGGLWQISRPSAEEAGTMTEAAQDVTRGLLAGLGGGLAFAMGNLVRKAAIAQWPEPLGGTALEAIGGLVVLLLLPWTYQELRQVQWRRVSPILLAGIASAWGIFAFLTSLHHVSLTVANLLAGVEPVISLIFGVLFFQQSAGFPRSLALGVTVVTLGVWLVIAR